MRDVPCGEEYHSGDRIDEKDMPGYLRMRAWKATREKQAKAPVRSYIDDVWPSLNPNV